MKFQLGLSSPQGRLVPILRYAVDMCVCGHTWAEHYQPKKGGPASCWGRPKDGRLIDECHDFELAGSRWLAERIASKSVHDRS